MLNDPEIILEKFHQYAKTFETLQPRLVLSFYDYPAMLIAPGKIATVKNWLEGFITFTLIMLDLKRRQYHHSVTKSLSVRQLSHDLAIVSGTVIRFKTDNSELERFGLTYTLRYVKGSWKIIVGALHSASE